MSTETGIVPVESTDIVYNPHQAIIRATEAAKALKSVIDQKEKRIVINGETYLEFEDWELVGHFYGLHAKTEDAVFVEIHGVEGAKARAVIINRDGIIIGGAEAYCLRDEDKWKSKPWFQLASMAQTRAASKAFSNTLRWVVVLAGYKGTPAEEMADEKPATIPTEHWCAEHKTQWFKRGGMKGFAHPIEGTEPKQWCNEPEPKQEPPKSAKDVLFPPEAQTVTPQPQSAASKPVEAVAGKNPARPALPDTVKDAAGMLRIVEACGRSKDKLLAFLAVGRLEDVNVAEAWGSVKMWLEGR